MLLRRGNDWAAIGMLRIGNRYAVVRREFIHTSNALPPTALASAPLLHEEAIEAALHLARLLRPGGWSIESSPALFNEAFKGQVDPFAGIEPIPGTALASEIRAERMRRSIFAKKEAEAKAAKAEATKAEAEAVAEFQRTRLQRMRGQIAPAMAPAPIYPPAPTPQPPVREVAKPLGAESAPDPKKGDPDAAMRAKFLELD